MGKRIVTFVLCLMIIINFILIVVPKSSNAVAFRPLELCWNPNEEVQEADVSPGSTGNVTFTGVARFYFELYDEVKEIKYSLFANVEPHNWNTTVVPDEMILTPSQDSQPFLVIVTVPQRTLFKTQYTLRLYANATAYPGNITYTLCPISGTIKVKQFYEFTVNSTVSSQKLDKGDEATYNISIINTGNARDTFHISVKNIEELKDSGLEIILYTETIDIESNDTVTIDVFVKTKNSAKSGKHNIELSIKSAQEELNVGFTIAQEITLTVKIEQDEEDYFIPLLVAGVIIIIVIVGIIILIGLRKRQRMYRPPYGGQRYN